MLVGFGVSVVVHAALLLSYAFLSQNEEPRVVIIPVAPVADVATGVRVLRVVEVAATELGDPLDPDPIEDVDPPDIDVEIPDLAEDIGVFIAERYRSVAERLRLSEGDPRLWAPIAPEFLKASNQDVLQARLAILVSEGNDSVLAEAHALARSTDWTFTDEEGKRWGLSPGMIHLGDITVPLPFGFGAPYDYNGERAEMAFRVNDIQRAAGSLAARQSWRDRVEAMKRRREERRARDQATRANAVKPDTTSRGPWRR